MDEKQKYELVKAYYSSEEFREGIKSVLIDLYPDVFDYQEFAFSTAFEKNLCHRGYHFNSFDELFQQLMTPIRYRQVTGIYVGAKYTYFEMLKWSTGSTLSFKKKGEWESKRFFLDIDQPFFNLATQHMIRAVLSFEYLFGIEQESIIVFFSGSSGYHVYPFHNTKEIFWHNNSIIRNKAIDMFLKIQHRQDFKNNFFINYFAVWLARKELEKYAITHLTDLNTEWVEQEHWYALDIKEYVEEAKQYLEETPLILQKIPPINICIKTVKDMKRLLRLPYSIHETSLNICTPIKLQIKNNKIFIEKKNGLINLEKRR